MAELHEVQRSSKSRFYVTDDCNGCGLCRNIAPEFFDYVEYAYTYFITRQPLTSTEIALMQDARDSCVLDAIREDADILDERTA